KHTPPTCFSPLSLHDALPIFIEDLAKLIALVLIVRGRRYKYILNGMLFGAAIGAGFACFETAGYAYRTALAYRGSPYGPQAILRSEEHTSELQSLTNLVCRLL